MALESLNSEQRQAISEFLGEALEATIRDDDDRAHLAVIIGSWLSYRTPRPRPLLTQEQVDAILAPGIDAIVAELDEDEDEEEEETEQSVNPRNGGVKKSA